MYERRPDLIVTGRTLVGAPTIRGQNTDWNYFGAMPPRVSKMMFDFQKRAWKLGARVLLAAAGDRPIQSDPILASCRDSYRLLTAA
eukprot:SAG22_NODE_1576_length_4074_cov_3.474717_3_plen_86_part_00